jgi:hypothetical protein
MSSDKTEEFTTLIEQYKDCPEELFKMAKTPFEKAVAVEFFMLIKKIDQSDNERKKDNIAIKKDIGWLKWLICAIFGIAILGVLSQWFPIILKLFGL